jgi:hypothetical protein
VGQTDRQRDDVSDRQTAELAEKLRLLAGTDPVLARALVAELVTALNRATDGAFGRHLSPSARDALGITEDAPLDALEAAWAASTGATDADAAWAASTGATDADAARAASAGATDADSWATTTAMQDTASQAVTTGQAATTGPITTGSTAPGLATTGLATTGLATTGLAATGLAATDPRDARPSVAGADSWAAANHPVHDAGGRPDTA